MKSTKICAFNAPISAPVAAAIREAVARNREVAWDAAAIRRYGEAFSEERFIARIRAAVEELAAVPGMTLPTAEAVYRFFRLRPGETEGD